MHDDNNIEQVWNTLETRFPDGTFTIGRSKPARTARPNEPVFEVTIYVDGKAFIGGGETLDEALHGALERADHHFREVSR